MSVNIFKLEEYLAQYEFSAPYLLCCSDAESFSVKELIDMASREEKELWDELRLGYTETYGLPILRAQIARSLYPSLDKQNILCFAGAEEGIFCSLYILCNPGDHVIALTPCYQSLMEVPMLKGCEITAVPLKEENNWRIDIDAIKQAIKPNTKCVVINFPHNPTGQVITNEESLSLISLLDKHGIWLFSDEVYRLLGNPSETWAKPIVELYHRGVSLGVMSKAFGLAGLRVGWIACQDQELLKRIEHMKHYTSICNSAPSEILTLIALKNMDRLLARNNAITEDNLKILDKFFTTYHDLFSWVRPEGGCVGLVKFKKGDNFDTFYDRLVKEAGVLLLPASVYDMPNNYFRIGFGRRNMPEALERFEKFLLL